MPKKYYSKNNQNFDPLLILSQIFLVLSVFYFLLILFTLIFNNLFSLQLHLHQIIGSDQFDLTSNYGINTLCAYFFTYLIMIAVYILIIDKAKNILDYVLTNFFLNIIITTFYYRFPANLSYWFFNILFVALNTLISEYICVKKESQDIPVNTEKNMKKIWIKQNLA